MCQLLDRHPHNFVSTDSRMMSHNSRLDIPSQQQHNLHIIMPNSTILNRQVDQCLKRQRQNASLSHVGCWAHETCGSYDSAVEISGEYYLRCPRIGRRLWICNEFKGM